MWVTSLLYICKHFLCFYRDDVFASDEVITEMETLDIAMSIKDEIQYISSDCVIIFDMNSDKNMYDAVVNACFQTIHGSDNELSFAVKWNKIKLFSTIEVAHLSNCKLICL